MRKLFLALFLFLVIVTPAYAATNFYLYDNPNLTFSGSWPIATANNEGVRYTDQAGAYVVIPFVGTDLALDTYAVGTTNKLEISHDGGNTWTQLSVSVPNTTTKSRVAIASGLTDANHVVRWTNLVAGNRIGIYAYGFIVTGSNPHLGQDSAPPPDTTPPQSPVGLVATPLDGSSIKLTWTANTEPDLYGYQVFRDGVSVGTVTVNDFTDTGLTYGPSYSYQVKAIDNAGNASALSSSVVSQTLDTIPPGQVAGVQASNIGSSAFSVDWSATVDAVKYGIYLDGVKVGETNGTNYSFSGLTAGTVYNVEISAFDQAGNEGQKSAVLSVRTLDVWASLPVLSGSVSSVTDVSAVVTWNDVGNTGFDGIRVYLNGVKVADVLPGVLSYTLTGLLPNTAYKVILKTFNSQGESIPSADINFTTLVSQTGGTGSTGGTPTVGSGTGSTGGLYTGTIGGLPIDVSFPGFAAGFGELFTGLHGLLLSVLAVLIAFKGGKSVISWFRLAVGRGR